MRATLPVSSLMRQGRQSSSLRKSNSNSPTVSPTNAAVWRARISPETSSSSGQRSPGSLSYKGTSIPPPPLPLALTLFPAPSPPPRTCSLCSWSFDRGTRTRARDSVSTRVVIANEYLVMMTPDLQGSTGTVTCPSNNT